MLNSNLFSIQFHAFLGAQSQTDPALKWTHGKEKRKKEFNIVEQIFETRA